MNSPSHLGRVAPDRPSVRRSGLLVVLLASAVLAGCASFSPDAGFSSITPQSSWGRLPHFQAGSCSALPP